MEKPLFTEWFFLVNRGEVLTFWHKCDIMKVYPDAAKNISKGE